MWRLVYAALVLAGALALLYNRRVGETSVRASYRWLRADVPADAPPHRFALTWSRTVAVLCGSALVVGGMLGIFGLGWGPEPVE